MFDQRLWGLCANIERPEPRFATQRFKPDTRRGCLRYVFDVDNHHSFRWVIDPVTEKKIVDQNVANLTPIIIDPTEVRDHERIRRELSRPLQELSLPTPWQRGEESTAESEKAGR